LKFVDEVWETEGLVIHLQSVGVPAMLAQVRGGLFPGLSEDALQPKVIDGGIEGLFHGLGRGGFIG
jgi:hypothetical protein